MLLGQILLNRKVLRPNQLDLLLSAQASTRKRLGELAVDLYQVPAAEINLALFEQHLRQQGQWIIS